MKKSLIENAFPNGVLCDMNPDIIERISDIYACVINKRLSNLMVVSDTIKNNAEIDRQD